MLDGTDSSHDQDIDQALVDQATGLSETEQGEVVGEPRMAGETNLAVETEGPSINSITEDKYGKIKHISIISEMEKSYLDYAMSVIVARALPDVRDGLKPVHRRILFSMYKSGFHHTSPY